MDCFSAQTGDLRGNEQVLKRKQGFSSLRNQRLQNKVRRGAHILGELCYLGARGRRRTRSLESLVEEPWHRRLPNLGIKALCMRPKSEKVVVAKTDRLVHISSSPARSASISPSLSSHPYQPPQHHSFAIPIINVQPPTPIDELFFTVVDQTPKQIPIELPVISKTPILSNQERADLYDRISQLTNANAILSDKLTQAQQSSNTTSESFQTYADAEILHLRESIAALQADNESLRDEIVRQMMQRPTQPASWELQENLQEVQKSLRSVMKDNHRKGDRIEVLKTTIDDLHDQAKSLETVHEYECKGFMIEIEMLKGQIGPRPSSEHLFTSPIAELADEEAPISGNRETTLLFELPTIVPQQPTQTSSSTSENIQPLSFPQELDSSNSTFILNSKALPRISEGPAFGPQHFCSPVSLISSTTSDSSMSISTATVFKSTGILGEWGYRNTL